MAKLRKFIWLIIIIILLGNFILAFNISQSFIEDTDINLHINNKDISYESVEYEEDITKSFIKNEDIANLDRLEKISPIIVKAKVDDSAKREIYEGTTLTKVIIKEVFKGDLNQDSMYVFEPFDCYNEDNLSYLYSLDGYNIMNEDSEYILFLREIKDSNYTPDDNIYMPTTTLLSKYPAKNKMLISNNFNLINDQVKYYNVKDLDIISNNSRDIEKYNEMKLNVLKKYENID